MQEESETQSTPLEENDLFVFTGKVLIVEDNKTNQMLMQMLLDDYDAEYDTANDGVEAVEFFKKNQYDIILMDENMPNMNGIEATKHIRKLEEEQWHKDRQKVNIIAVTANALSGEKERFLDAGMDGYISKPYGEEEIRSVLMECQKGL